MRHQLWIAIVLLLTCATAGCGGVDFGGSGTCHITADNPHESKNTPGDIVGKARISCTVAADEVELTVRLELRSGTDWVPIGTGVSRIVHPVVVNEKYTAQDSTACAPGMFRTAARDSGTLNGRQAASVMWTYSQTMTDPCTK
jgi:hypothetical protein